MKQSGKRKTQDGRGKKPARPPLPEAIYRSPGREMSLGTFLFGFFCRMLIAALGASGILLFWYDAAGLVGLGGEEGSSVLGGGMLFLIALALTAVWGFSSLHRVTRWAVPLGAAGALAVGLTIRFGNPAGACAEALRCLFNSMLRGVTARNASYGYLQNLMIGSDSAYRYGDRDSLLLLASVLVLTVLTAALAALLLNGIRPAGAFLGTAVLTVPVFMFNITRTNYGFALVIAFLSGCVSLWICDSRYLGRAEARRKKRRLRAEARASRRLRRKQEQARRLLLRRRGTEARLDVLAGGGSRTEADEARREIFRNDRLLKKKERQSARLARRTGKRTSATGSREKTRPPRERAVARKEERGRRRQMRTERRMQRRLGAAGAGFAGILATVLALGGVWTLAFFCRDKFPAIPLLYDPISTVNAQITAILTGGDVDLNDLSKHNNLAELDGRPVDFKPKEETDTALLRVRSSTRMMIYLRQWIAAKYDAAADSWEGLSPEEVDAYRQRFGADFSPDDLRTAFYRYLYPSALEVSSSGWNSSFYEAGFAVAQVSVARLSGGGYLLYTPSYMNTALGVLEGNSLLPNPKKTSYYYEGMYSSRNFRTGGVYSTVSFLTTMLYGRQVGVTLAADQAALEQAFTCAVAFETLRASVENDLELLGREVRLPLLSSKTVVTAGADGVPDYTAFLEVCDRYLTAAGVGANAAVLVRQYVSRWTEEQRDAFFADCLTEMAYRSYVYEAGSSFTQVSGSEAVSALAAQILAESGLQITRGEETFTRFAQPSDISYSEKRTEEKTLSYTVPSLQVSTAAGEALPLNDLVMAVIDALCHSMTYSKNPVSPAESAYDTVLEQFLLETKEGYCLHFATAAAAILREYGLAVRYCEGAIVTDLSADRSGEETLPYSAVVTDQSRHAWIEVYFDGIGWVQYECTPAYYTYMYETDPDDPVTPPVTEPTDPDTPLPPEPPVTESPVTEPAPEGDGEDVPHSVLPFLITVLALGLSVWLGAVILRLLRRAAAETVRRREALIAAARSRAVYDDPDFDRRAVTRELTDGLFDILNALGAGPQPGELTEDYGRRLLAEYGQLSAKDPVQVLRCVQKEEFGEGLTFEELNLLAGYLEDVSSGVWQGLAWQDRLRLRYRRHLF